jgi:hypothetical protein
MTLTVTHLSCGVVSSGETGGLDNIVLRTASAGAGALGDHQLFTQDIYSDSNIIAISNSSTIFYVTAGDKPVIDITSTTNIIATTDGGCLVSGTMAK